MYPGGGKCRVPAPMTLGPTATPHLICRCVTSRSLYVRIGTNFVQVSQMLIFCIRMGIESQGLRSMSKVQVRVRVSRDGNAVGLTLILDRRQCFLFCCKQSRAPRTKLLAVELLLTIKNPAGLFCAEPTFAAVWNGVRVWSMLFLQITKISKCPYNTNVG